MPYGSAAASSFPPRELIGTILAGPGSPWGEASHRCRWLTRHGYPRTARFSKLADGEVVMLVLPAPSMVDVSKLGAVFDKQIRLAYYEEDFACAFRLRAKGDAALRERGARVRRPNVGEH